MTIRLFTDGGADYPEEWMSKYGVIRIPLHVTFDGVPFDVNQGHHAFYDQVKTHSKLPQTASPSPQEFVSSFERYPGDELLVIALSSGLSSTYQHAMLAKEMMAERGFAGSIEIIDSRTASLGMGVMIYQSVRDIANGLAFEEVVRLAQSRVAEARTFFYLDTLENVIKGGRLDRAKGAIASVLNIKLVMQASSEGAVEVAEKVRGKKNALCRLVEKLDAMPGSAETRVLGIAHSCCEAEAILLKERIEAKHRFGEVVIASMGPVIGTYAGEGGLLICYA